MQRTGWGKSLVYWITTRVRRDAGHGSTLIISPLLALMRDLIAMAGATNTLAADLDLIGYRVPEAAGRGRAGETIRILAETLSKGRSFAELTTNQQRRWHDLPEHNRHDCVGIRRVTLLAARQIGESISRSSSRRTLAIVDEFARA